MSSVAYAPATLSNLGPGFDVLGLALDRPLDSVQVTLRDEPGITLRCTGPHGARVPDNPELNLAAYAARRVLAHFDSSAGIELIVEKNIPPGSGLGSSAASAAAAIVATTRALKKTLDNETMLAIGRDAEALAAGAPHLDNIAPALLGGFVAVTGLDPPRWTHLNMPEDWWLAVIAPQVEVRTADARALLPQTVPLEDAVTNLRHLAGLLAATERNDLEAFCAHLEDRLANPYRAQLLPFVPAARAAACAAGASALQISGSGPALFAPCGSKMLANAVCAAVAKVLHAQKIDADTYLCRPGCGAPNLESNA